MKSNTRIIISVLVVLFLLFSLNGCQQATKVQSDKPKVINISYSYRPLNLPSIVALDKKIFEQEFAKDGIEVKWYELEGPAATEALAAKSIDIAMSLNYVSAIITKTNGNDIKIISSYTKFPQAIGLVVGADTGINAISDLKGKKIALQKGTMLHEMLIKALEEVNISSNDVEIVGMTSADGANAVLQKHVEAAILPEPLLTKVISSKNAKLLRNADGLILGQSVIAARSDFLQKYPDIAKTFLKVHDQTVNWSHINNDEALTLASKINQMDIKAVKALYPKFDFTITIDQNNISELKEAAIFLKKYKFLKDDVNTDTLINSLVDTSYLPR